MLSRPTPRSNTLLQTHNRSSILRTRLLRQRKKTLHRQRHKPQHAPFQNTNSSGDGFPPRLPPRNERNLLQPAFLLGFIKHEQNCIGLSFIPYFLMPFLFLLILILYLMYQFSKVSKYSLISSFNGTFSVSRRLVSGCFFPFFNTRLPSSSRSGLSTVILV